MHELDKEGLQKKLDQTIRQVQAMDVLLHEYEKALMAAGVKPETIKKLKDKAFEKRI